MGYLENELQAELETTLNAFGASRQSESTFGAGLRFQGRILDWVQRKVAEGILGDEAKIIIRDIALKVFDSFDIPYIGGVVEAAIKSRLRPAFEALLNQLLGL